MSKIRRKEMKKNLKQESSLMLDVFNSCIVTKALPEKKPSPSSVSDQKLPFNSDEFQTGLPTLNKDETKLYFISDRPESIGKTDIFVVDINSDGTYGEPKNL